MERKKKMSRIGLALEGGGAKGAYHIGAYRALLEQGICLDGVVGTSIGAINGAMIAQGDGEAAWDIWATMQSSLLFDIDPQLDAALHRDGLTLEKASRAAALARRLIADRGLDTTKIKAFIDTHIDEPRVRASGMDFGLVTVSLTDRKPLELMLDEIPKGKLTDYVLASASLPGFKTAPLDGRKMVDGGIWNNLPLSLLVDRGYDSLIAVRTRAVGRLKPTDHFGVPLAVIEPTVPLGPLLDFSETATRKNLMLGYLDTQRLYCGLRGRRYYIEPHSDREWAFLTLGRLDETRVRDVGNLLGIEAVPPKRMLFEHILPKLAEVFRLGDALDYEDLWAALLESAAERVGLDPLRIYPIADLAEQIAAAYERPAPALQKPILSLAKVTPRLGRLVQKKLLDALLDTFFGLRDAD